MHALDAGWTGYQRYFIYKWRRSLLRKQQVFPRKYEFDELERFRTLGEMTEHFVIHHTEYPDLLTYLRGYAITGDRLGTLRVPAAMLLADDDPVIPIEGLMQINTPKALDVYRSSFGGHCGFIENARLSSWLDSFIAEQLRS
jgi:predicted alpha/beta-fold hydrolase